MKSTFRINQVHKLLRYADVYIFSQKCLTNGIETRRKTFSVHYFKEE
jgi:hypothetical protein